MCCTNFLCLMPFRGSEGLWPGGALRRGRREETQKRTTRKWRRKSLKSRKTDSGSAPSSPLRRQPQRPKRQRRGQPLHDHREGDDREGRNENVVAPRQIGRQGERKRQSQRAAEAAPPHEMLLIERDRPARA